MSTPDVNTIADATAYLESVKSILETFGVGVTTKKTAKVYLMSTTPLKSLHAETPPPALFYHVWNEMRHIDEAFETFCISEYLDRCNLCLQEFSSRARRALIA